MDERTVTLDEARGAHRLARLVFPAEPVASMLAQLLAVAEARGEGFLVVPTGAMGDWLIAFIHAHGKEPTLV